MVETTTKQILIDVQLKADQLTKELPELAGNIAKLTAYQKEQTKAGQQGTLQFQKNAQDLRELSAQYREANKYIDNSAKVRNAENNSIQQNRALLSLLTNDYVKLGQTQGKTSAATISLGNQINNLTTKLKAQEAQIGQTYRNVGNYTQSILTAIPGMGKYSTMITNATRAFNLMGNASKDAAIAEGEAGAATSGLSATTVGLITSIIGAIAVIGLYISELAKLTPNAEAIQRTFSGVGNVWRQMVADFSDEKLTDNFDDFKQKWGDFFGKMKDAYVDGKNLKQLFQDLARSASVLEVSSAQADAKIADIQLKMRNRRNTPEQEQLYFNQIQKIIQDSYVQRKQVADAEFDLAVRAATQGRNFTNDEIKQLREKGIAYAAYLDKIHGFANKEGAGTDLAAIAKAQENQTAAERFLQTKTDKAQNFLDAKQLKAEAAYNADLQKQEDIKQKIAEINSERQASIAKMLGYQQEAFGKEISSTDEHYRQLIFKQQKYISDAEKIKLNKKSSPKTKALADQQISAANKNIDQYQQENYAESQKILIEHNRLMIEIAKKGALDLAAIEIQSIEDGRKRELAAIKNKYDQQVLEIKKTDASLQDSINKLNGEIASKSKEKKSTIQQNELQALKTTLNEQNELLGQNAGKFTAYEKAKEKAIGDTNKKFDQQNQLLRDQTDIINKRARPTDGDFKSTKPEELAEKKLVDDKYEYEKNRRLEELAGETKDQIDNDALLLNLKANHEKDITDLTLRFNEDRAAKILAIERATQNAALNIVGNNIKSQAQASETHLKRAQQNELANTSLTSAQKLAVNNKYRILEGQQKVKEFRANQKLQIAQAIADGALAMIKTTANTGLPLSFVFSPIVLAETALAVGTIAAQKPPAFAQGGTFKSDGKGSVLPGYSRKDNVNAQLRSGEAVIVSEAVRDPYARSILSAINTSFGGRSFSEMNPTNKYAIGGIVTDGNNSNRYYAQPQEGTQNLANQVAFSLINNFPPVMVDVKDINNQQGILVNTQNRVRI